MTINNPRHTLHTLLAAICLALCLFPGFAWGEDEDDADTTGLFTAWQESTSTASRSPKPLSQTAENVTIITAKEIEQLNAHTLADILDTIPGIQIQHNGGPGITAYSQIQSSEFTHILVFVDGVSITNLGGNYSPVNFIPARIIERVEIVKGAASSSWGQALGGVINVITKSPDQNRLIGGAASATIGEHATTNSGLELTGSGGRLGYYLSGGYLGSNGVLPGTGINAKNAHVRLTYDLPGKGQLSGSFNYFGSGMGDLYVPSYDLNERSNQRLLLATLGLRQPLGDRLELELTGRHTFERSIISWYNISDGATWQYQDPALPTGISRERVTGGGAKLIWRGEDNLLVAGGDYEHIELESNTPDNSTLAPFSRILDRWDAYLNDTIGLGAVSVTPGARIDRTRTNGDQFSYSLGATWKVSDTSVLRAYTGRGYGLPEVGATDKPSIPVWTSQMGVESTGLPYLWLKGTLFRNQLWDVPAYDVDGNPITERHIALGTELELRTIPFCNTSLGAGWTFTDTTRSNGTQVLELPRNTVKIALRYNDQTFRGVLTGQHIFWNSAPGNNGRYGGLVWDLHLGATLLKSENSSLELFFSGHNLFRAYQYSTELIPNPGRWFDGGLKVSF